MTALDFFQLEDPWERNFKATSDTDRPFERHVSGSSFPDDIISHQSDADVGNVMFSHFKSKIRIVRMIRMIAY